MPNPPTSTQRGYGYAHQRKRRQAKRQVDAGLAHCWRCIAEGKSKAEAWIEPGSEWDLGHDDQDRSVYRGPEHARCNRRSMAKGRATARAMPSRKRSAAKGHPGLTS